MSLIMDVARRLKTTHVPELVQIERDMAPWMKVGIVEGIKVTEPRTRLDNATARIASQYGFDPIVHMKRFTAGRYTFADLTKPVFVRQIGQHVVVFDKGEWHQLGRFLEDILLASGGEKFGDRIVYIPVCAYHMPLHQMLMNSHCTQPDMESTFEQHGHSHSPLASPRVRKYGLILLGAVVVFLYMTFVYGAE